MCLTPIHSHVLQDESLFLEVFDEEGLVRSAQHCCARRFDPSRGASFVPGGIRSEQTAHARWKADEGRGGESARLDLSGCKKRAGQDCQLGLGDSKSEHRESEWLRS